MTNVYEIDATTIDDDGLIVPRDLPEEDDGHELNRSVKSDWAVKVVNDGDADVDATPLVSTSDDSGLEEFDTDNDPVTVGADDVDLHSSDTVAAYLGVELTADPAPTDGTVKIVFNSRLYGGA